MHCSYYMGPRHHHGPQLQEEHRPRHALVSSLTQMTLWPLMAAQNTQISIAQVVARLLDTKMVLGGCPDPGHLISRQGQ